MQRLSGAFYNVTRDGIVAPGVRVPSFGLPKRLVANGTK